MPRKELEKLMRIVEEGRGFYLNSELLCFPIATQVRIKDTARGHKQFKQVGALVFQTVEDCDFSDGEYLFGILTKTGCCFDFPAEAYEIVSLDVLEVPAY